MVDSRSTGWTDEKHNLYLSSIEESFVNQLYSSKYNSKVLLGLSSRYSRTQKHGNSSVSNASSLTSGQVLTSTFSCFYYLLAIPKTF